MKKGQRLWTRDELIIAINLYCKLPFGKLHQGHPEIIRLAELIDRTPGSVAYKLVNFASLDPSLQERGIKGASNASKLDKEVWNEFYQNWDELPYESEKLRASFEGRSLEELFPLDEDFVIREGKERERLVKQRVNQNFFRQTVMAAYDYTCCITGLRQPELLIAGHIRPWATDEANRLNPRNGIAINALHDKAFEHGLLTISQDYIIRIAPELLDDRNGPDNEMLFGRYDGKPMRLPKRFLPDRGLLK